MILPDDINVYFVDFRALARERGVVLEKCGHEMCIENADGSYTVLIDAAQSRNIQVESYHHACDHIYGEDFDRIREGASVQQIEAERHRKEIST